MPEICSDVDPENKLCQGEDEDRNNHDYDDDQLIMIIIKQSLPSSRQVQLATRLTAWSVAQVQLRPAQGGVGQNITEEATACHIVSQEGMFENCPSVAPDYLAPTDC